MPLTKKQHWNRVRLQSAGTELLPLITPRTLGWRSHLGQVSQRRSLPAQLIQDAAVKGLLLLAAAAQLRQVGVIQTGPVLREGLGTVPLNLSTSHRENRDVNRD